MKEVAHKVQGGKLIRIKMDFCGGKISLIQICGDFFLYPEDALPSIEHALIGKQKGEISETVRDALLRGGRGGIETFGFSADDLIHTIEQGFPP